MNSTRIVFFACLAAACRPSLAADLISADNPALIGAERGVYAEGQAFVANDIVPLSQINKEWREGYRPRSGTNIAIVSTRIESGVQWQGFRLGYIQRNEWFASANRDTVDAIRADRQKADFDAGRSYALDDRVRGFTADGVRLAKSFSHNMASGWKLNWGVAASEAR